MLRFMAMEYFSQSPVLFSALFALAIFMLVFVMVTLRTVLTNKTRYETLARLPLEDEERRGGSRG
jgi:hypothetical protein